MRKRAITSGQSMLPRRLAVLALAVLLLLLPLATRAQLRTPAPVVSAPPARALPPPAPKPNPDRSRRARLMSAIADDHAKLWYAVHYRNWPLAAYSLAKLRDAMADAKELMPASKKLPLAKLADAFVAGPLKQLGQAVAGKNVHAFVTGYRKLTEACNGCHRTAGLGFIMMRRPRRIAFPDQDFRR